MYRITNQMTESEINGVRLILEGARDAKKQPLSMKKLGQRDKVELSEEAKELYRNTGALSKTEKSNNRDKIDLSTQVVSFNKQQQLFYLADGSTIPLEDVNCEIDYSNIPEVKATDNKLIFQKGYYYLRDENGEKVVIRAGGNKVGYGSFANEMQEYARTGEFPSVNDKVWKESDILSSLIYYSHPAGAYIGSSKEEVIKLMKDLGFEEGKIEIGVEGGDIRTYYLSYETGLWSKDEEQSIRNWVNNTNHLKIGIPRDAVYVIQGKEYAMDENGYYHVPEGVMCKGYKLVDAQGNPVPINTSNRF